MSQEPLATDAPEALVSQFVEWVGRTPRTYGETMDAWRTSCPRLAVWEEAVRLGLVRVKPRGGRVAEGAVELTRGGGRLA